MCKCHIFQPAEENALQQYAKFRIVAIKNVTRYIYKFRRLMPIFGTTSKCILSTSEKSQTFKISALIIPKISKIEFFLIFQEQFLISTIFL